jgi:hypothetical protein
MVTLSQINLGEILGSFKMIKEVIYHWWGIFILDGDFI